MAESTRSVPTSFKGDWITPDSPEYDAAIIRWARNARRRAAAVAFVRDPADVVVALAHARASKLPVAVRGGGHNVAGASSIEGGIVIDLSRHIAGVRVDAEKRIAYIGGGALWETVDKEGMRHGLATVGGTVNNVRLPVRFARGLTLRATRCRLVSEGAWRQYDSSAYC
jgi:FAD/FMN-containing dehydrogenase